MKKDYIEMNEKLLVELARQDEMKNRKIFSITVIASILCVVSFLAVTIISALAFGEGILFGIIMVISTMVFIGSMFLISKYEVESGYHACRHCDHKFVPTYFAALMAPQLQLSKRGISNSLKTLINKGN